MLQTQILVRVRDEARVQPLKQPLEGSKGDVSYMTHLWSGVEIRVCGRKVKVSPVGEPTGQSRASKTVFYFLFQQEKIIFQEF